MSLFADIIINRKSPAVDRVFTYNVPEHLQQDIATGFLVNIPFNKERLDGVVIALHSSRPQAFELRDIISLEGQRPLFNAELLELSQWLAEYYHCSRAQAMQAMLPSGMSLAGKPPKTAYEELYHLSSGFAQVRSSAKRQKLIELLQEHPEAKSTWLKEQGFDQPFLRSAVKSGLLIRERRRLLPDVYPVSDTELSEEQQQAYSSIDAERQTQNRPYLLHGVTGSGKTEIYLRLIADAAQRGQQSILLVPEIALSTQMIEMLGRRLDLPMALLHSGLSGSERRRIWQDIAEGRISVVVGARSAVFAPTPNLGLIIIDEEHENSYKQENNPRFHALTVAEKRRELTAAQLVLGSATPSVESYFQTQQGKYALGELHSQYYSATKTEVSIVDMRQELRQGHRLIFSRQLLAAMDDTLAVGGQIMLFLNRRGYYNFFSCRDCGAPVNCSHCAVALSFHESRGGGRLKCHYCGYSISPPQLCPACNSERIRHFGIGTQRVEDEARRLFPEARIARLDSDVMSKKGGHQRVYRAMVNQELDILVGTQMIAKGLDFAHLQLAAVIAADTMLYLPDWRANERTFQLISQVIGRAGRRDKQGQAIIQTYNPQALPIVTAAEHDYQSFYSAEIIHRQMHGYPPYTHLLRLLLTAREQESLIDSIKAYAVYLAEALAGRGEICGPAEAPYARIKDRYRWQIIIKADDIQGAGAAAQRAWQRLKEAERLPQDILFSLDIDPQSMF